MELLQRQEWIYLFFADGAVGLTFAFWGLLQIPPGILVHKPDFMPSIISILLVAGGVAYIVDRLFFILFPGSGAIIKNLLMIVFSVAEISFIFWLFFKEVK